MCYWRDAKLYMYIYITIFPQRSFGIIPTLSMQLTYLLHMYVRLCVVSMWYQYESFTLIVFDLLNLLSQTLRSMHYVTLHNVIKQYLFHAFYVFTVSLLMQLTWRIQVWWVVIQKKICVYRVEILPYCVQYIKLSVSWNWKQNAKQDKSIYSHRHHLWKVTAKKLYEWELI